MVLKRLALAAALSLTACSAQLATLPPNDNYVMVEGDVPRLTGDEQKLADEVNVELVRLGLPRATLGSYEQNAAAIMANAALARVWNASGRAVARQDPQEIAPPVSGQQEANGKHEVANGRLASLTDEEDDTIVKHLHTGQHLTAHGIPQNVGVQIQQTTYAQTSLDDDQLQSMVRVLRPDIQLGQLRIGVAILPVGDADARLFVVAMRDQTFDLSKGPRRFAAPGTTFEIAGTVYVRNAEKLKFALQGPDGKIQLGSAAVDGQGNFASQMSIPNAPGLYIFSAAVDPKHSRHVINVPIFAGVAATPWPPTPDPNETPVAGTRSLSQKMANALAEWRHSHGLPAVAVDATLSAFAKAEATLHGNAEDQSAGEGSGAPHAAVSQGAPDRARAAGFDGAMLSGWWSVRDQDYINDYFARFPPSAFEAAAFSSPTLQKIGVGVAMAPNTVTKDSDLVRYAMDFVLQDPTPPQYESGPAAAPQMPPLTVAIRADGSASVDGAQVDDARLKQDVDMARSVNPNLTVLLQVEAGTKPEVVDHVTQVLKAEGVVNIVDHSGPSSTTAPGTTPPAPAKTPPPTTPPPPGNW